jgi:4'-phosphopantetheinyl transferase
MMNAMAPHILQANERNIDIWLAFYHEMDDQALRSELRRLLTDEERRREVRFYFPDDQKRYLITRAMVRTILSRYLPLPAVDWRFDANEYGRPRIANPGDWGGLSFNISHTKGLIALAITGGRELGVDVENVADREVSIDIADRFFAPPEVEELYRVPAELQQDRFFEYWTFKESYIKARGMGLSIPLDQFNFYYPHERAVRIAIEPKLGDDANRWSFWQFRPTPKYLLALCAERRADAPTVTVRKMVPTVTDELLEAQWLKTSDHG